MNLHCPHTTHDERKLTCILKIRQNSLSKTFSSQICDFTAQFVLDNYQVGLIHRE